MKQITLFFTIIISCSIANAAIITVDNKVPCVGQYKTLKEGHDAANNGDTIYVCPSEAFYVGITVNKKLIIIGTGHSRPGERLSTTLISGRMQFDEGADGSALKGFGGYFSVIINANDTTIQKNRIKDITVNDNHKGTAILQNYIYNTSNSSDFKVVLIQNENEVFIANNVFNTTPGYTIFAPSPTITISIFHNILKAKHRSFDLSNSNIYVANNIIISGTVYYSSNNFYNNMSYNSQLPKGNGNLTNIDMATVFIDPTNDFHLLEDSPAKDAGTDGVDMGIYGGSTPYIDDGRTSLPSIVKFKTDYSASHESGLEIEIQAVSNNQ